MHGGKHFLAAQIESLVAGGAEAASSPSGQVTALPTSSSMLMCWRACSILVDAHDAGWSNFFNTHAGLADKSTLKYLIAPPRRIDWVIAPQGERGKRAYRYRL